MGIKILKKLNTCLPDSVKNLFAPVIRGGLINNKLFEYQYNCLMKADSLNSSELETIRNRYLKETLVHAYEHTRYYRRIFDDCKFDVYNFSDPDQLKKLPLLSKKEIVENFEDILADDIQDYYEGITGGSTGTPLKLLLSKESIYLERAFVYHYFQKFGYDYKKSKIASFRGTNFNGKNVRTNPLYNEIQMNPCNINNDTIYDYWRTIRKFGAEFLHGFPSAIYSFCKYADENNISLNKKIKAVFCVSENLYDFQKEYIEKVLGCPCTSFYGHTERNAFAEMDDDGLYRFNGLYGYCELTEKNEIVSIGFINKKMPLIRYVVDDTAVPLGNGYKITGHRDGFLYGKNGELLSGASLEVHSDLIEKIISYQLVQREKGKLIVIYIPGKEFEKNDEESFRRLFQDKVGGALDVEIKGVQEMILTKRSKFKLIVQELPGINDEH